MYLPEEIWLIIFKYLDYYDINNLVILRQTCNPLVVDMEHIKEMYYSIFFKKFKIVSNLIYTFQNIKTITSIRDYMKVYSRNFYTNYEDASSSKIISLYLRRYLGNKITDSKNKKKFKNLTMQMERRNREITVGDIKKFKYKDELDFFIKKCISK